MGLIAPGRDIRGFLLFFLLGLGVSPKTTLRHFRAAALNARWADFGVVILLLPIVERIHFLSFAPIPRFVTMYIHLRAKES